MNEQQLEERFQLAVADEPPLGFDPDDIVDRATRRQRNRRAVTSVVAAVAAVAAITAVTNMVTTASYSEMPIQPASPQSSGLTCPSDYSEMNALVARKFVEVVPTLPYRASPILMGSIAPKPGEVCEMLAAWPSVSGDLGSPSVGMVLAFGLADYAVPERPEFSRTENWMNPDGSTVSVFRVTDSHEPTQTPILRSAVNAPVAVVVHQRIDGSTVQAATEDLALASIDQLKALATDPEITF